MNKRPHRRKHKDNPYILEFDDSLNAYMVSFKDGRGIFQKISHRPARPAPSRGRTGRDFSAGPGRYTFRKHGERSFTYEKIIIGQCRHCPRCL